MKSILVIILIFSAAVVQAKSIKEIVPYQILSDTLSTEVPNGYCRISGTVTSNGWPVINGLVANYGITYRTSTDSLGNYSLLIPEKDSIIFFYAAGKSEILIQPYDFKNGHHVIIHFFPQDDIEMIIVDKPVIYAYSTEAVHANFQLFTPGNLIFTYPLYDKGWNMTIDKNGMRDTESKKTYPYLFWEGEIVELNYLKRDNELLGTYLKTDTLVSFLENQLTLLGLNRTEQTDFITFWGPRITAQPYAFVQFMVDDEYAANIAELTVSPKPDAMRRVYMLFSGFETDQHITTSPQQFKPFIRKGFNVLEWGGSEINLNKPS